jgi:hypothetical protein
MQNVVSMMLVLLGLGLALLGAWLTWGAWSMLTVVGAAIFAFGLFSID